MSITAAPTETALHIDTEGAPITEGTLVVFEYTDKPNEFGVITFISDADGDVDGEGRAFGINPSVTVTFADGETEKFDTSDTRSGWWSDTQYQAEDLNAATYGPSRA